LQRYRIDKKEFGAAKNDLFFDQKAQRAHEHPPPTARGTVAIECGRHGGTPRSRARREDFEGKEIEEEKEGT
jgi:hypothetical protein